VSKNPGVASKAVKSTPILGLGISTSSVISTSPGSSSSVVPRLIVCSSVSSGNADSL
jgi:hypothetical protein